MNDIIEISLVKEIISERKSSIEYLKAQEAVYNTEAEETLNYGLEAIEKFQNKLNEFVNLKKRKTMKKENPKTKISTFYSTNSEMNTPASSFYYKTAQQER